MFLLLTRVLLWILVAVIVYYVLLQLVPKEYYTFLGLALVSIFIVLAFLNPSNGLVSTIWSILSFPLKPLGASILLIFFGAMRMKKGSISSPGAALIWTGFLILLLSSVPFLAYQLAQGAETEAVRIEQRRRELCQGDCPAALVPQSEQNAAAIVILGQGTTEANLPYRTQIQLNDTGDRILYAAQLYQQLRDRGNPPYVIVSAGPRASLQGNSSNTIEANDISTLLQRLGVPRDRIIIEPRSVDLRSSATEVNQILRSRNLGNERIILVTSGVDSRRASLTFSNVGIRVISRPADFYTFQSGATPSRRWRIQDFIPTIQALALTTRVWEEYLASIYYFLRGWLSPLVL